MTTNRTYYFLLASFALTLLFLSTAVYIRTFGATSDGLGVEGPRLVGYHAARLGFAVYLAIACYSLGYWTLLGLHWQAGLQGRQAFIVCFFLGASTYGIAFGIFGLLQILTLPVALLSTIPTLFFMRRPLKALTGQVGVFKFSCFISKAKSNSSFTLITFGLVCLACVSVLLFVATRVVFIPNPDTNVWEHYLHYYRIVIEHGSTLPNEVWHHFFNSKGGGLVFLAILLSDVFSVQLVSACMVVAAGVIVFDILSEYCNDGRWPIFGLIVYFAFFFGDVSDGGMFRVHALILGYAAFLFWGWQQLGSLSQAARPPILMSMVVSLAYIGFYQPVAMVVFAPAFVLMTGFRRILGGSSEFRTAIIFCTIIICGSFFTLSVNWLITGLPEVTPMKFFWSIAEKDEVRKVFGTGGIDYLLAVNSGVKTDISFMQRFYSTIHHPRLFNTATFFVSLAFVGRAVLRLSSREPSEKAELFVAEALAFLMPLILLSIFFPSRSVERMGLYSIVFVTMASVIMWERVIGFGLRDLAINTTLNSWWSSRKPISLQFKEFGIFVVMVLGGLTIVAIEIRSLSQYRPTISGFNMAGLSLKGTMEKMGDLQLVSGTNLRAVSEFRELSRFSGALLSLTYNPGYAYFLPGRGFVSEPTYSLIRDPKRLLTETPDAVASYLRENGIEYIIIDLPSQLFTTVAFTTLFDVTNIQRYFEVAYERDDIFVLRLRHKDESPTHEMPNYLLTRLELKRAGILHFPFTKEFEAALTEGGGVLETVEELEISRVRFLDTLREIMFSKMLNQVTLSSSKSLINNLLLAVNSIIMEPEAISRLGSIERRDGSLRRLEESRVRRRWVALVRDAFRNEYVAHLGVSLAFLAEQCDERDPFAIDRPSVAICQ